MSMDDEPAYERFLMRLASFGTLIAFDRLGIGLSDPIPPDRPPTVQDWTEQLGAVLDSAGVERAHLVAHAGGGMAALVYAAQHPDRVAGLVFALAVANYVETRADDELIGRILGSATPGGIDEVDFLGALAPSRANDAQFRQWWNAAGQRGASPSVARTLLAMQATEDARPYIPEVSAPTLVLYRPAFATFFDGDMRFGRDIPGARVVEVDGVDALPWLPDSEAIVTEIEEFVTGARGAAPPVRSLLTVMFTDVVGSTSHAAELGDRRWRDVLESHDRVMRRELARHGGTEIDTAGDGFLSTFASPSQAVQCASRLHRVMAADVGLQLRVGIHCGEVEVRGPNIAGIAVHIAARVQARAEPGQTLVTSTVREAMTGAGFSFVPAGAHVLKGVPEEWHLFALA